MIQVLQASLRPNPFYPHNSEDEIEDEIEDESDALGPDIPDPNAPKKEVGNYPQELTWNDELDRIGYFNKLSSCHHNWIFTCTLCRATPTGHEGVQCNYEMEHCEDCKSEYVNELSRDLTDDSVNPNSLNPSIYNYDSIQDGLGSGAHAVVFRSKFLRYKLFPYNEVEISVAVKVFRGEREKWKRESEFLKSFDHPHVAKYFGKGRAYCKNKMYRYIVLELGERSLRQFLDSEEHLSWHTRISIALGVTEGLFYLHSLRRPLFHRDLKASNISIRTDLSAFLIDFSLSKYFSDEEKIGNASNGNDVDDVDDKTKQVGFQSTKERGTFGYMAPEMRSKRKGKTSLASDIFSLGIVFYEILTRMTPPLVGPPQIPTAEENPAVRGCPTNYLEVMKKCWSENSSDRPDLEDILKILKNIKQEIILTETLQAILPEALRKFAESVIEYATSPLLVLEHTMTEVGDFALVDGKHIYTRIGRSLSCLSLERQKLFSYEETPSLFYTHSNLKFLYLFNGKHLIALLKDSLYPYHTWDIVFLRKPQRSLFHSSSYTDRKQNLYINENRFYLITNESPNIIISTDLNQNIDEIYIVSKWGEANLILLMDYVVMMD